MSSKSAMRLLFRRLPAFIAAGSAVFLLFSTPVWSVAFEKGTLYGSWDTTLTYGASWRLEDPDSRIIGLANGGSAFSVNGDDGTLNYDTGPWSNAFKITSEIELNYGNVGAFFRGRAFYDYENEEGDRQRTSLSDPALRRVGKRAELLDAYLWVKFDVAGKPAEFRVGNQVLSWGESTFIQNSINTINPVDVSSLRVPGAELREALLPEGLASLSFTLSSNTALELFYQYHWSDVEVDPPGSYFGTNDFVGDGGDTVLLGFGSFGDVGVFPLSTDPSLPLMDATIPGLPQVYGRDLSRPTLGVSRALDRLADDGGQYGAAFRWFVPALGETEFGFYYINYHSRLPIVNGITGTLAGLARTSTAGTAAATLEATGDAGAAITAGTNAGVALGLTVADATAAAATAVDSAIQESMGGLPAGATRALATDLYSQTASYLLTYPEDIQLLGVSFNTQLGTSGVALQGEISHRLDAPLQVDDVELLFAALSPISPVFAGQSGIPDEPGASQLVQYLGLDVAACLNPADPAFLTCFEATIPGFVELDVSQVQVTATKVFGPTWGASTAVLVGEVAGGFVHDMPDKDVLRFEAPATYTSGNPYHEDPASPGAAHAGKTAEAPKFFADDSAWGYRVAGRLDYNNAVGAVNLSPRFSWQHDVSGISPGPGGNFLEDRKAITVGLMADYQNSWSADVSYTRYYGAGRHNLITDRDFLGFNIKYSF